MNRFGLFATLGIVGVLAAACFTGEITDRPGTGGDGGVVDPGTRPLEVDPPQVTLAPGGAQFDVSMDLLEREV